VGNAKLAGGLLVGNPQNLLIAVHGNVTNPAVFGLPPPYQHIK
jgi:hypothetical protein